jgi:hypothetical protein
MVELALPRLRLYVPLVALALASACDKSDEGSTDEASSLDGSTSSESSSGESGSGESTSTDTTTDDTTTDDTTTGEPIMCPGEFPSFDEACSVDEDCALVLHTIDCCGTELAWGIRADAVAAFEAAEAVCDGQYPACDCAPMPTLAEDGQTVMDASALAVACTMGACTSYVQ